MESFIDIILKEKKGCGVYLDDNLNPKTVEDYIKNSAGNIRVIIARSEDIGVSEIDEYLQKVVKEKFNLNSLDELVEKLSNEGRNLFIIFDDIEKLSFYQLKSIEKLCKEGKDKFAVILLGKTKAKELIDSFYFKDLREIALFLVGCGYIRKEKVKEFSENYLSKLLGSPVEIEKGVEDYLYKISEKNQKKLENILKDLSKHMKGNILSLDIIKAYSKEKGLISPETQEEKVETKEEKKPLKVPSGTVLAGILVVISLISLFLIANKDKEEEKITKEIQVKQQIQEEAPENIPVQQETVQPEEKAVETAKTQDNEEQTEEAQQPVEEKVVEEKPVKYAVLKTVNVYKDKKENTRIIGRLKRFQVIIPLEIDNDFVYVDTGNIKGWVKKEDLVEIPDGKGVVIAGMLNLRDKPGTQSVIISAIPRGTVVDILTEKKFGKNTWLQVIYHSDEGTYQGWISGKYVLR